MKWVRFAIGSTIGYGVLEQDELTAINTTPWLPWQLTEESFALEQVKILAPCLPSKVVAVGLNYRAHAEETGQQLPEEPRLFLKPSTSVIGPGDIIVRPKMSERVDYEGELAVVIGRAARDMDPEHAAQAILGYTCANDVTARDLQRRDVQFTRAKGFDTFCPLGPWIETDVDPSDLRLTTRLNGEVRQDTSTTDLIFDVPALVSFVSHVMTMLPGDVVLTGTPAGIGPMRAGDVVEVEISGVGTLTNTVG